MLFINGTSLSQKFCNICIRDSFSNKLEFVGIELMPSLVVKYVNRISREE